MKKIFTLEHAIHGVIVLCAATSLENIHDFFLAAGHPETMAWLISLTLASGVVTTSIMLTQVDAKDNPYTFWWMLGSSLSFAFLSGGIQSAQYSRHGMNAPWNFLLGFSLPITGEVVLAWAASLFILHRKQAVLHTIQSDAQAAVTGALVTALQTFDSSTVQDNVNLLMRQLAHQSLRRASENLLSDPLDLPDQPLGLLPSIPAVVLGPEKADEGPVVLPPKVDLGEAIDRVLTNPGPVIEKIATVIGLEKITPSVHCLVTKKNGDVYLIESIDGDLVKLSLRSQPSYRREVRLGSIPRYYDIKKLTDL